MYKYLIISFLVILISCGVSQSDYNKLKEENAKFKKTIQETETKFKFDYMATSLIPKSRIVKKGDKYEAEICIKAINLNKLRAEINGKIFEGDSGVIKYEEIAKEVGIKKIEGNLFVTLPYNEVGTFTLPFSYEYKVVK